MKDFFNLPRSSHVQEVGLQENDFRWLFDCTIQDDPMDLIPDDCASDQEAPYTVIDIDIPLPNAALPKPTAQLPVSDFYPSLPPSRPVIESTATHGDMSASLVKPDIDITLNFPRNSKSTSRLSYRVIMPELTSNLTERLQSPLESHDCLEIRPRKRARYVHNENANGTHAMALDNTSEFGGTDKTEIDEKSKLIYLTPVHTSSSKGNLFPTVDVARVLGQPLHGPGPAFPADVKTVRKVRGSRDPIDLTLILPDNCVRSRKRTWKLR